MTPIEFVEASRVPIIPVALSFDETRGKWLKTPLLPWTDATTDEEILDRWWQRWPDARAGIPLRLVDWAVVDADGAEGIAALGVLGCLGPHSVIATPSGGQHQVFAQPPTPITKLRWCEGVEILGSSCLLTAYDLEELMFPHVAPRAILPKMFWKPKGEEYPQGNPKINSRKRGADSVSVAVTVEVATLTAALWQCDPCDWRGEYDAWFQFATACRFLGVARAEFVKWSTSDPYYAADARQIERIWNSAKPAHGGAFWRALSERGIKLTDDRSSGGPLPSVYLGVPLGPSPKPKPKFAPAPTRDLRHRTGALLAWLAREPSEPTLFRVACVFAEMVAEGRIKVGVATRLLEIGRPAPDARPGGGEANNQQRVSTC